MYFSGAALDADDPAHVDWVLEKALERAQKYGELFGYVLVVVKN